MYLIVHPLTSIKNLKICRKIQPNHLQRTYYAERVDINATLRCYGVIQNNSAYLPGAGSDTEAFCIRIVKPCCMSFTTPLMPDKSAPEIELIRAAYAAFNARDIDAALALMTPDVAWPKAFKGGFVRGPEEVRAYWMEQWSEINPHVEPAAFHPEDAGQVLVEVHQVVRDLTGAVLADEHVSHRFTIEHGLIQTMEICPPPLSGH